MDDLISRQAAIDAIRAFYDEYIVYDNGKSIEDLISELPSAQPRWIPVTERLPKDDDWQLVTILDESGDTPYRYSDFGWYLEAAECWIVDANQRRDIIAWTPLPEPWKGEKDE